MLDMSSFGFGLFIIIVTVSLLFIFGLLGYLFKAIALNVLSKRRELDLIRWLCYIPLVQDYILGFVFDSINDYRHKQTNYRFILLVLSVLTTCINSVLYVELFNYGKGSIGFFAILLLLAFRIFKLIALFNIYKDYSTANATGLLLLSIFLGLDFIILFVIRKNVPVSMCLTLEEELFHENLPKLQQLWEEFHSAPQTISWSRYLNN